MDGPWSDFASNDAAAPWEEFGKPAQTTPSRVDQLKSAITDIPHKIYEAGSQAVAGMNEAFNPNSNTQRERMEKIKNSSFLGGLGEQLKSVGDVGAGLISAPAFIASPITGTARSVLGHTFEAANPLTAETAKKAGVPYVGGDEAADLAMMGMAPSRGGLQSMVRPVQQPTPPTPNGPLGVTLSEGQATGELPLIRAEQAAKRGQMGPQAEEIATQFGEQQAAELAVAKDQTAKGLDQFGQKIVESPQEAGQLVSDAFTKAAAERKAAVTQAYEHARSLPGEVHAGAFEGIGQKIKGDLSLGDNPVIIDDKLTPFAARAIDDVDQRIAKLRIQNKADPFGQPSQESISGISLAGVDQMRKRLSSMRKDAFNSGNAADGRAAQAVIDAFDNHVDQAINGGMFTGDPRTVQAWNDARATYTDYRKTFTAGKGDPVGRVVEKILGKNGNPPAIANDVADYLYGAQGINPSSLNVGVAKRVKSVMGERSPEWSAVRQGLFSRLIEPGPGQTDWGPGKIAQRLNKFLNADGREMANALFTPAERQMLQSYADLQRKLEVPKSGANWSETSTFVAPMFKKLSGVVATSVGAILGHMAAPGMFGEAVGAVAGSQVGKLGDKIANLKNARAISRQMPIIANSMQQYQKALAAAQKANTPIGNKAVAVAATNLGRSLKPLGISLESIFESQGTVPAGAQSEQQ